MATTYSKITYDGKKVQVDSAIRDGNGKQIDTNYQEKLSSGTNIKTVNGNSLLGSGNITIQATAKEWVLKTDNIGNYISVVRRTSPRAEIVATINKDMYISICKYSSGVLFTYDFTIKKGVYTTDSNGYIYINNTYSSDIGGNCYLMIGYYNDSQSYYSIQLVGGGSSVFYRHSDIVDINYQITTENVDKFSITSNLPYYRLYVFE